MNSRLLPVPRPVVLMLGAIVTVVLFLVLSTIAQGRLGPVGFGSSAALAQDTTTSTEAGDTTTTAEETTTTAEETTTTVAEDTTTTTTAASTTTAADSDAGAAPSGGAETGAGGTADSGTSTPIAVALAGGLALAAGALYAIRRLTAG